MAEPIKISFRYVGPEVENGEMDIDEVSEALKGFSGAYGKIAARLLPDTTHQVRVAAIKTGSFDVLVTAVGVLAASGDSLKLIENVANAAKFVFRTITYVIGLKKHTKGEQYSVNVDGVANTVNVFNIDKVEMHVPVESFELFKEKILDGDLNKIASPLSPNRIESAELKEEGDEELKVTINSDERDYFRSSSVSTKTEAEFVGNLVSLNKETNRGLFKFNDFRSCRYHFTGGNEDNFRLVFSRKGPVRVTATVEFDENLTPLSMDIKSVESIQGTLPLNSEHEP